MRYLLPFLAALVALPALPLRAEEPASFSLTHRPAVGLADTRQLRVVITEILLAETPTGLTGNAATTSQLQVKALDPGLPQTVLQTQLGALTSELAGRKGSVPPGAPFYLRLDPCARLLALSRDNPQAPAPAEPRPLSPAHAILQYVLDQGAGDLLAQGGIPVQALAAQCTFPLLPDHPVKVGDSWQVQSVSDSADGGQLQQESTVTLQALANQRARFCSTVRYALPDFQASNPLLPGTKMRVHNAVLDLMDFVQDYDLAQSLVLEARGKLRVTLEGISPDMTLPLQLSADVTFLPLPPPR